MLVQSASVDALNFAAHPSRQHQPDHLVVAHKRPQRILKSCRFIFFNEEVTNPGSAVAGYQRERKEPPPTANDKISDAAERDRGAGEVQETRARMAVLANVVGPKFGE